MKKPLKTRASFTSYYRKNLPPLPKRAISGLPQAFIIPTGGSPFHIVHIWEFTNLYGVLEYKTWKELSRFLKQSRLIRLERQLQIKKRVLEEIHRKPNYVTHISNLFKIGQLAGVTPSLIEKSVRAVRFSRNGALEKVSFPFKLDIYAWRVLCHTAGDGTVKYHKTTRALPEIKWAQKEKNQKYMLELLKRWNPRVKNSEMTIKFPKALTYAILGSMPGITFRDLRSPRFIKFVLDLPMTYRDWKVQFLTAFLLDDGSICENISFTQMDKTKLEHVMELCDQLGYAHSPYPPKQDKTGIYTFRLRAQGALKFHNDLQKILLKDPLLDLWQKHHRLEKRVSSYSNKTLQENNISEKVYIAILTILGDRKCRTNRQLMNHPKIRCLIAGRSSRWFQPRTRRLNKLGLIQEAKPSKYRKYWEIPPNRNTEELIQEFYSKYHSKGY